MMMMATKQDMVSYKSHPMATTFLSQFTNWAKIWMSPSSKIPRKRRNTSTSIGRETDIRSRTNYYEPPSLKPHYEEFLASSQKALLYRATCQKLRPANNQFTRKLVRLGDILHVRKFWDDLEMIVYKDLSSTSQYLPPSKRLPFNPDKPGSIYLPRKSKRNTNTASLKTQRRSFASSTIVYSNTTGNIVRVLPLIPQLDDDDDDDVPLGALHFFPYSK
ncbi:hypothetical protein INT47_008733 [Mucor saturninus]|uniref:Uncharacterized protein n=1 Tax=Mucor saturninus TaxID=64648 RepID=A0A8H7RL31_9FUNG|nr:hypothetical protein INT47_008733 [Mucor saturninus]